MAVKKLSYAQGQNGVGRALSCVKTNFISKNCEKRVMLRPGCLLSHNCSEHYVISSVNTPHWIFRLNGMECSIFGSIFTRVVLAMLTGYCNGILCRSESHIWD